MNSIKKRSVIDGSSGGQGRDEQAEHRGLLGQ